jgi:hypothetical protein
MTVIIFLGCKSGVGRHALELDLPEVIDAVMVHSSPHLLAKHLKLTSS